MNEAVVVREWRKFGTVRPNLHSLCVVRNDALKGGKPFLARFRTLTTRGEAQPGDTTRPVWHLDDYTLITPDPDDRWFAVPEDDD